MRTINSLFFAMVLFSGCVTTGGADKDGLETSSIAGQSALVVQQSGKIYPVISKYKRSQWLSFIEDDAKGLLEHKKMAASLAVGNFEDAEQAARKYLAKHPGDVNSLTILTAALAFGKKYNLAVFYAQRLEEIAPGRSEVLNIRGVAAMMSFSGKRSDLVRAEELFKNAFSSSETEIAAGLNLGHLYLEQGNAKMAREIFETTSTRCGQCTEALVGVGIAAGRERDFDRAKEVWKEVLDKNPNNTNALYHLALVQWNGYNDRKSAIDTLERLLAIEPADDKLLRERADTTLTLIKGESESKRSRHLATDEESQEKSDKDGEAMMKEETDDAAAEK